MELTAYGCSDTGKVRYENEDAFFVDAANAFFAVADGMGGLPGGANASQKTIDLLQSYVLDNKGKLDPANLYDFVKKINHDLAIEGNEAHPFIGWGTTLSLCNLKENLCQIIHVGDSAIYRVRDRYLKKLTADHTLENRYINDRGEGARSLMPAEYAHTLTRCIGHNDNLRLDQKFVKVEVGDMIMLCTDGLTKYVGDEDIRQALVSFDSIEKAIKQLIKSANDAGGSDNIAVIAFSIDSL
jgi:protein phosphatase